MNGGETEAADAADAAEAAEAAEILRLRTLLQAFETELHDLGRLAETAQARLSGVLAIAAKDPDCHREAQVLDLLTQRLYGMSEFLATLSPGIPPGWRIDAAAAVESLSLSHLANRLSGQPPAAAPHGELEMF